MPDLHELLDDSVGAAPPFDLGALARRRRRHRQHQVATLAAVLTLLAALSGAFALGRATSDTPVAIGDAAHAATTTAATNTTLAPTTTTAAGVHPTSPPPPTVGPTTSLPTQPTSAAQRSSNPGPDDFDGILVAAPTSATVGQPVTVAWAIRNRTDHGVVPDDNPTLGAQVDVPNPDVVALVCMPQDSNGRPRGSLGPGNLFVPDWSSLLASGSGLGESDTYTPTADDVGTVTCEVVILDRSNGLSALAIADRVHAIAPVTITVTASDTTTTTTAPTTTTSP